MDIVLFIMCLVMRHFRACAGTLNVTQLQTRAAAPTVAVVAAMVGVVAAEGVLEGVLVVETMTTTTMGDRRPEVPVVVAAEVQVEGEALAPQYPEGVCEEQRGQHLRRISMVCQVLSEG